MGIRNNIVDYFSTFKFTSTGVLSKEDINQKLNENYREKYEEYLKELKKHEKMINENAISDDTAKKLRPREPEEPKYKPFNTPGDLLIERLDPTTNKAIPYGISLIKENIKAILQANLNTHIPQSPAIQINKSNDYIEDKIKNEDYFIEKVDSIDVYYLNENDVLSKITIPFETKEMVNENTDGSITHESVSYCNPEGYNERKLWNDGVSVEDMRMHVWENKKPRI